MTNDKDKSTEAALKAEDSADAGQDDTIVLSSGVVLKAKPASPLGLMMVFSEHPRPSIPVYFDDQMGREMENPDDPDYIDRVKEWQKQSNLAVLNALILMGTDLESLPKKFPGPNSDGWLDEYELLGLRSQRDNPRWRYLKWVLFKAATTQEDLQEIRKVVGRISGIPEEDVEAAATFPGDRD